MEIFTVYFIFTIAVFTFGLSVADAVYWKVVDAENTRKLTYMALWVFVSSVMIAVAIYLIRGLP